MLAALIKEGHHHVHPVGGGDAGSHNPFQVLEMVVRGHVVGVSADRVGDAVVHHIHHHVDVRAADRLVDHRFGLAGAESGAAAV